MQPEPEPRFCLLRVWYGVWLTVRVGILRVLVVGYAAKVDALFDSAQGRFDGEFSGRVELARTVVQLGLLLKDPLGLNEFLSAYLEFLERVGARDFSDQLVADARRVLKQAPANMHAAASGLVRVAVRARRDARRHAARVRELKTLEHMSAQHNRLSRRARQRLDRKVDEFARRLAAESRAMPAAVAARSRSRVRRQRRSRTPAQRTVNRTVPRRECTSSDDGDGPADSEPPRLARPLLTKGRQRARCDSQPAQQTPHGDIFGANRREGCHV
jgi:hypothetical protein